MVIEFLDAQITNAIPSELILHRYTPSITVIASLIKTFSLMHNKKITPEQVFRKRDKSNGFRG